jgi:GGDEF domain-containing protein
MFEYVAIIITAVVTVYSLFIIRQIAASGIDLLHGLKLLAYKVIIALSLVELASYIYVISENSSFKPTLSASIVITESVLVLTTALLLRQNVLLMQSLKETLLMYTRKNITGLQDHDAAIAVCSANHADSNSEGITACGADHAEGSDEAITAFSNNHACDNKSDQLISNPATPGLHGKHELNLKLDEEMVRANRQRVPLFFAILSIDNDEMPDNVFAIVDHVITNNIRAKIDTGFICSDREFAIILPFTVKKHAVNIVKRILISLNTWDIDASIGLVSCSDIGTNDATEVIKIAELAASEARAEGGNRIRLLRKNSDRQTEYIPARTRRSNHLKLLK